MTGMPRIVYKTWQTWHICEYSKSICGSNKYMDPQFKGMLFTAKMAHRKMKLEQHKMHCYLFQLEDGFLLSEN
jgi:hypothetical protein